VAISGRKAARNRNFFWIGAFSLTFRIRLSHIADNGLPTVIHMNMLDADNLMSAVTQASKNLYLRRIRRH